MKSCKYPIHPDFQKWTKMNPPISKLSLAFIQPMLRLLRLLERSTKTMRVDHLSIPGKDGASVTALLYSPVGLEESAPCLINYHGGGYVFPASPHHYKLARAYALKAGCKVLFVDYRLAPKHPFPAAPEDCYSAYLYVLENAASLGIDAARIAVGGDSAGGNLSAGVCIRARDEGQPIPCGQMLLYPTTGPDFLTESVKKYTDTPMCNSRDMGKYTRLYLPQGGETSNPILHPMRAETLEGMPTAYIETAEFDCLHDDGVLYGEKLRQHGIAVEINNTEGTMHGFDIVTHSPIVQACVERRTAFLRTVFSTKKE